MGANTGPSGAGRARLKARAPALALKKRRMEKPNVLDCWHVYHENADTDGPSRFIGMIEAETLALALQKAAEFYEHPSHDLVVKPSERIEKGTFDEIYSYAGKAWTTFRSYGAIVAGICPDNPKRYL